MQTKGKKKIIDNAGALQKKYAWKSEKTQDTKKAPQDAIVKSFKEPKIEYKSIQLIKEKLVLEDEC